MPNHSGNRESVHWIEVCGIVALLLYSATYLQGGQIASLRGGGVPDFPLVPNYETSWGNLDVALSMPSSLGDLRIPPNIDPEGMYNVPIVNQPPVQNIDADNAATAEADLEMLLALAEVVGLPRQIERDEEDMIVRRPQEPSSVAESGTAALSTLVDDVAAGAAPQHPPLQSPVPEAFAADAPVPEVVGILAGALPQQIEDEDKAHSTEAQVEDPIEDFPPGMLELTSGGARFPRFAAASMTVPAGDLESNLEQRMRVDHPDAGNSSEGNKQIHDDVENLEVEEPHAKRMQ